jgi:hypothetical protein
LEDSGVFNTENFEATKSGTFLFPIGSSEGQWNARVILTDDNNNETNLGPNELGQYGFQNSLIVRNSLMSVKNEIVPIEFNLYQNHPNPFNPFTKLKYDLPKDSFVSITIYDMRGSVIKNLVNTNQSSGFKSVQWNVTDNLGKSVPAGMYIYTIQAGEFRQTKKMILLK